MILKSFTGTVDLHAEAEPAPSTSSVTATTTRSSTGAGTTSPRKREAILRAATRYPLERQGLNDLKQLLHKEDDPLRLLLRRLFRLEQNDTPFIPDIFRSSVQDHLGDEPSDRWFYSTAPPSTATHPTGEDQGLCQGQGQDVGAEAEAERIDRLKYAHNRAKAICRNANQCVRDLSYEPEWNDKVQAAVLEEVLTGMEYDQYGYRKPSSANGRLAFHNITRASIKDKFRGPELAIADTKVDYGIFAIPDHSHPLSKALHWQDTRRREAEGEAAQRNKEAAKFERKMKVLLQSQQAKLDTQTPSSSPRKRRKQVRHEMGGAPQHDAPVTTSANNGDDGDDLLVWNSSSLTSSSSPYPSPSLLRPASASSFANDLGPGAVLQGGDRLEEAEHAFIHLTHHHLPDGAPILLAVSLETKPHQHSTGELGGSAQLATWARAHFLHLSRVCEAVRMQKKVERGKEKEDEAHECEATDELENQESLPTLPLVLVQGFRWTVDFAQRRGGKMVGCFACLLVQPAQLCHICIPILILIQQVIYGTQVLGSTDTLEGTYKVIRTMQLLTEWAEEEIRGFWEKALLG